MSYLVLARKYRPRNFREMVGQPHVVTALGNALVQKRLHHAYLFTGTRGVGKTTVSRILAKSLNCVGTDGQGDITAEPCGVCEACRAIDAGNFVDYTELDAASNRGVDEVQQLLEQAVYKPVQGRFKVFMIDEVHMLTNTAFNAMLKTLEEPPEYLKFVLATTDPQKVPVTVLSRCLQFNLRPMAPETVLSHLSTVLQAEQVPSEPGALTLLSRAARGSMRDALSLTDQAIAFGGGSVQEATVRQMLGAVDRQLVFQLIEALAQADGQAVVSLVDQARAAGLNAASLLEDMAQVLQHMAVMQAVGQVAPTGDDPDQVAEAALAAQLPRDETQLLYSMCIHGRAELGLAPDEYAGLTMVLLRLLAFKPEAEKKTLESAKLRSPALAAPAAPALAVPAQAAPVVPSTPVAVAAMEPVAVPAPVARAPVPAPQIDVQPAPVAAAQVQTAAQLASPVITSAPAQADTSPSTGLAPTVPTPAMAPPQAALRLDQALEVDEHASKATQPADATADDSVALSEEDEELGPPPVPSGDIPPWEAYADEGLDDWDTGSSNAPQTQNTADLGRPAQAPPAQHAPEPPLQALPVRDAGHQAHAPRDAASAPSDAAFATGATQVSAVPLTRVVQDPAHGLHDDKPLAPLQRTELGTHWHEVVTQLVTAEAVNGFVRELALQSELVAQDGARWQLRCASALLGNANSVDKLQAAMREAGHAVQIEVTQGDVGDTPALRNQHAAAAKLNAARSLLEGDPFVQALQRDFAATIVPHSIKPL